VPGSIYDKLGLKNGDTIMGVDGQPINDPAKAFELLGKLKEGASHMELAVKKPDGKTQNLTYDIH
jgi:type II secretory pathway component PulC